MNELAKEKIIVALDTPNLKEAESILRSLSGQASWVKIGLQLFIAAGPDAVKMALDHRLRVFLDLKIHDIPNTARMAVRSALKLGVEMLTLHCLGGKAMMKASSEEAEGSRCRLLGVTLLTSMDEESASEVGVQTPVEHAVERLARLAVESGMGGVVASPLETRILKEKFPNLVIVTPGIRPLGSETGDQKRVLTPEAALKKGSDYLVVGRPVTSAPDPGAAFRNLLPA